MFDALKQKYYNDLSEIAHSTRELTPEEIIAKPENGFVKKFILNQLEIKKNNIYTLFAGQLQEQAQVC